MEETYKLYLKIIEKCKDLFLKKNKDYGSAWRIMRLPSITDQILIKAQRIRIIQEKGEQKISDSVSDEFVSIVNYCIIALMQIQLIENNEIKIDDSLIEQLYDQEVDKTTKLLFKKNHDYGEAWKSMRITSITDIILMKLLRLKQIEDNEGKTIVSEGIEANYRDILNYAVFSLIKLGYAV
jgi:hypothetical protein